MLGVSKLQTTADRYSLIGGAAFCTVVGINHGRVSMRQRRPIGHPVKSKLTDEAGQPITFASPGEPPPEERRRFALAMQRSRTPAPLDHERQAEVDAIRKRRRQLLSELGVYVND